MKTHPLFLGLLALSLATEQVRSQTGPFPVNDWPATRDPSKIVHYVVTDGGLEPPSENWVPELSILSGGDQMTADIAIGGFTGKKATSNYLNVADPLFEAWADSEFIDILVQAYGDEGLFSAQGAPRDFRFLTGVLPELAFPVGGQVPIEGKNRKWNWILFRIANGIRPSDGMRLVGTLPEAPQGAAGNGGVNGGTIRFEGVPNLIVRVVAFGQEGAFGTPEDINKFEAPETCDPEPETNLVGIDVSAGSSNHVQILDDGDQRVVYEDGVGPAGDQRRVVKPVDTFLNFGITDSFLGKACNDPRNVKVCVEFYDDPAFLDGGVRFGPEAYATDAANGIAFFPEDQRQLLTGSGQWIRRSWVVSSVSLRGVNAGALTAGPRFVSVGAPVAVSSFQMAVLRTGEHPLAGQDPLENCFEDPAICTDAYGSFAELDLKNDIKNGLDVGSSGGDQNMIVEEAGPENDRRLSVRPAYEDGTPGFTHQYINFAITEEALGPTSQPPALLAVCATYYDDPNLAGATLRPEVYRTVVNGTLNFAFTPGSAAVVLEGSGEWRDAYWELPNVNFSGVNQGPQAAARFTASGKIAVSRLRYAVIRPCGPNAGKNLLEECKPPPPPPEVPLSVARVAGGQVRLSWPATAVGFVLQSTAALGAAWENVGAAPVAEGDLLTVSVTPEGTRYYRLAHP
ncbi:MAG: hypothetical protein AB7O66_21380 [Limisphaerales bacterium]